MTARQSAYKNSATGRPEIQIPKVDAARRFPPVC